MANITGERILSTLGKDGTITVELAPLSLPAPTGSAVVVQVEAAPVNPSDTALMFAAADVANARFSDGRIVANVPDPIVRAMEARHALPLQVGNECAGTVVAAGEHPAAQALIGKKVACTTGTGFATHTVADAAMVMALDEGITAEQGASSFVNPMTALGFVETMKREGFTGIVHTAAASNLGQMLVKICAADGIPLVNIVRSEQQVALLRDLGAQQVLNAAVPDFASQLADAISETGAMMAFDPIRGGTLANQIIVAMERAAKRANADAPFTIYGSNIPKRLYVYGVLDFAPLMLSPGTDFAWQMGGWLLPNFLQSAGTDVMGRMRTRIQAELTTTFSSHYTARIGLAELLKPGVVKDYIAARTGQKYLLRPNG